MDSIIFNSEIFKRYPRNDNYYISRNGEVYSVFSKKIIKLLNRGKNKKYYCVDIWIDGKQRHIPVHRAVYETWIRLLSSNEQVNHKDDNCLNNNLSNLYVGSQKDNISDCFKNNHRVGNVYYLTLFDRKENKVVSFCPARNFIKYSGHPNASGSLNKFFHKKWFRDRFEIIEFKRIKNIEEKQGVTTIPDECKEVE